MFCLCARLNSVLNNENKNFLAVEFTHLMNFYFSTVVLLSGPQLLLQGLLQSLTSCKSLVESFKISVACSCCFMFLFCFSAL